VRDTPAGPLNRLTLSALRKLSRVMDAAERYFEKCPQQIPLVSVGAGDDRRNDRVDAF